MGEIRFESFRDELEYSFTAWRYTSARGRDEKRRRGGKKKEEADAWSASLVDTDQMAHFGVDGRPCSTKTHRVTKAARENVQGKDRPRKEYQSIVSSLCKHSWLAVVERKPAGLRESQQQEMLPHGPACVHAPTALRLCLFKCHARKNREAVLSMTARILLSASRR